MPEPLTRIGGIIAAIAGLITGAIAVGSALGAITVTGGTISIVVGKSVIIVGSAAVGGMLVGFATAVALIIVIAIYSNDRCTQGEGLPECIGGVVTEVVESFNSTVDELLPFTAMHDRLDVVTKSAYWDAVESGNAFVFCTDVEPPHRSAIMRCYFYDPSVCDAAKGAEVGAVVGAFPAVVAAALVALAIGCATLILCLVALLVAVLVAAAIVLAGALVGGQIGKGDPASHSPTSDTGETFTAGHLITVHGNMERREYDSSANVLYFSTTANFHGASMSPQPFSYCEVDDELQVDGCEVPPVILR